MSSLFGRDRIIVGFDIETGVNDTFVLTEEATDATVTINPGTWWQHDDADATFLTSYPSWIDEVLRALDAASPNGASYSYTLADYGEVPNAKIQWTNDLGVPFQFDFASPSTLDGRLLGGFGDGTAALPLLGVGDPVEGLFLLNSWRSVTAFADDCAAHKQSDPTLEADWSSEDDANAYGVEWYERLYRKVRYREVAALHVHDDVSQRGADSAYRTAALGVDPGIAFATNAFEHVWGSLRTGATGIWVHDEGDEDLAVTTHPYEVFRLRIGQRGKLSAICGDEPSRTRPERFDLDIEIVSTERNGLTY